MVKERMISGLMVAVMTLPAAAEDFVLYGTEHLDVTRSYTNGTLYDSSTANAILGGSIENAYVRNQAALSVLDFPSGTYGLSVLNAYAYDSGSVTLTKSIINQLMAYDSSRVDMSGGSITASLSTYNNSSVTMSGGYVYAYYARGDTRLDLSNGEVNMLYAYDGTQGTITNLDLDWLQVRNNSHVDMSGSRVKYTLNADGNGSVDISGGSVGMIKAYEYSRVVFHGHDFVLGNGLSWDTDGQTILGTGLLSGKGFGETEVWTTIIDTHVPTATIMAVPEPVTMILLGLGGLALVRWKQA